MVIVVVSLGLIMGIVAFRIFLNEKKKVFCI